MIFTVTISGNRGIKALAKARSEGQECPLEPLSCMADRFETARRFVGLVTGDFRYAVLDAMLRGLANGGRVAGSK